MYQPITTLTTADANGVKRVLGAFETVKVTRSIEAAASSFDVSGMWPGTDANSIVSSAPPGDGAIATPGAECTIEHIVGGQRATVLRGWIDRPPITMDETEHSIEIAGKSFTGQLVECSAIGQGEWVGRRDKAIIGDIANAYGINVEFKVEKGEKIPRFVIESGETAYSAIERVAALRSLLVYDDEQGSLVIDRARDEFAATALDVTSIKRINIEQDASRIFNRIVVRSQEPGSGDKPSRQGTFAEAIDTDSFPWRPERVLIIDAESPLTEAQCKERADWEHATRFGQAMQIVIAVAGWTTPEKGVHVWKPNTLIHYTDAVHGIDDVFLISEVTLAYGQDTGHETTLRLQPPAAFEKLAPAKRVQREVAKVKNAGPGKFPLGFARSLAESYKEWLAALAATR